MKIQTRIATPPSRAPYPQLSIICKAMCDLTHYSTDEAEFRTYSGTPDELEVAAQALLDLAHALRTELAAYEERKGQEPKPEEVQP